MTLILTLVFIFTMVFVYFDVEECIKQTNKLSEENDTLQKRLTIMIKVLKNEPNISEEELEFKIKERWNKASWPKVFNMKEKYSYNKVYKNDMDRSIKIGKEMGHLMTALVKKLVLKYLIPFIFLLILIGLIIDLL